MRWIRVKLNCNECKRNANTIPYIIHRTYSSYTPKETVLWCKLHSIPFILITVICCVCVNVSFAIEIMATSSRIVTVSKNMYVLVSSIYVFSCACNTYMCAAGFRLQLKIYYNWNFLQSYRLRALEQNPFEMAGMANVVIIRLAIYSQFRYIYIYVVIILRKIPHKLENKISVKIYKCEQCLRKARRGWKYG